MLQYRIHFNNNQAVVLDGYIVYGGCIFLLAIVRDNI